MNLARGAGRNLGYGCAGARSLALKDAERLQRASDDRQECRPKLRPLLRIGLVGLPLGAVVAVVPFPGRREVAVGLSALMGLPPVVVGLLVYLMLSNAGPLGWLQLLYTPTAMIIGLRARANASTALVTSRGSGPGRRM